MNVQPSKHLILINGHTHQGPWFEGNSQLSFDNPFGLAECQRNYFNNQIINVAQNLWKNYHFIGSTDRISVFGPRPYSDAIAHFSSQGKLQRLSQFYIVDFVTSMLFTMSMHVILHKVLLILLMVIHPMLPLLIDEITTVTRLVLLYLSGLHKSQNILLSFKYVVENPKLIHDTLDFAEDFDSPICLVYTTATICLACTTAKIITIFKMHLKSRKP